MNDAIFKHDLENERKIIDGGSSKEFFAYIKKKTTSRDKIPPLMEASGVSYTECDSEKAAVLSDYFCSVFTKDNNILPNFVVPKAEEANLSLKSVHFSEYVVSQKITKLKTIALQGMMALQQSLSKS